MKPTLGFAFPNLPYLVHGDVKMTETAAIHRYLADGWNRDLLGKTPAQRGQAAMLEGVLQGIKGPVTTPCYAGEKEKALEAIQQKLPAVVQFMTRKFLTGDEPVYVDFFFFELLELIVFLTDGGVFSDHPRLVQYHRDMANLPGLKEYLESDACREKTYTFNNKHAQINNAGHIGALVQAAYAQHLKD